jgi:acyl-CoA synthetase (AMP-forming)/AMP-acid ligase II
MSFPDYEPTVPNMIRALAKHHREKTMLVDGERRVSFAEAERESARLARTLLADGVVKGTRVGLLMANSADWVVSWLAAARIGAVVVPLNTFSRAGELRWLLRHSDVATLLCHPEFLSHDYLAMLEEVAPELLHGPSQPLFLHSLPCLRRVHVFGPCDRAWGTEQARPAIAPEDSQIDERLLKEVEDSVAPADPMAILYTSGSTADPKGAVHAHGAIVRYAASMTSVRGLRSDDRIYSGMPFFWAGGFVYGLVTVMQAGACLLNQPVFDPGAALEMMERERATMALGWPHTAQALAEHPDFARRDISSLRAGNMYAILPAHLRPTDPELRHNSLGMTETCGPHTFSDMSIDLPEKLRGSFGRPIPGMEHRIVDPDTNELLPSGAEGEICVRGYSLMLGLHKLERETTFDSEGFYHTGDMGRFDEEGHLYFTGRRGDVIKTAGANVSPREVEIALESLASVKHAFVVGVPDATRGQAVAAAVALHEGESASSEVLRAHARTQLSAYKVPRHILLFDAEDLPFLESEKIDKRTLLAVVLERLKA